MLGFKLIHVNKMSPWCLIFRMKTSCDTVFVRKQMTDTLLMSSHLISYTNFVVDRSVMDIAYNLRDSRWIDAPCTVYDWLWSLFLFKMGFI